MTSNECTVLVNSCDAYEDVWQPCFSALNDKWPSCPFALVLNTESKKFVLDGVNVKTFSFYNPNARDLWGKRLRKTLAAIESEFIFMMFDDYIVEQNVDEPEILKCMERMKSDHNIAAFYFINIEGQNIIDHRFDGYELLPKCKNYKINTAPALWRKDRLINYIGDQDTPWAWEFFGSARAYNNGDLFYCSSMGEERVFVYQYRLGGAIHRGKWVRSVIEPAAQKYDIKIDFSRRGFQDEQQKIYPHSLSWKVKFLLTGFRMIGFKSLIFVKRSITRRLWALAGESR